MLLMNSIKLGLNLHPFARHIRCTIFCSCTSGCRKAKINVNEDPKESAYVQLDWQRKRPIKSAEKSQGNSDGLGHGEKSGEDKKTKPLSEAKYIYSSGSRFSDRIPRCQPVFYSICHFLYVYCRNFRSVHTLIELSLKRKSLESKSRTKQAIKLIFHGVDKKEMEIKTTTAIIITTLAGRLIQNLTISQLFAR